MIIEKHFHGLEDLKIYLSSKKLEATDSVIFTCWYNHIPNWNGETATTKQQIIAHMGELEFINRPRIQFRLRNEASDERTRLYLWYFTKRNVKPDCSGYSIWTESRLKLKHAIKSYFRIYHALHKFLFLETPFNHEMLAWMKNQQELIKQNYELIDTQWSPINKEIDVVINFKNQSISFADPSKYERLKRRLRNADYDIYACIGNPSNLNNEDILFMSLREKHYPDYPSVKIKVTEDKKSNGIILAALIYDDFQFIEPWIQHYLNEGVKHFLIYYNHRLIPEYLIKISEVFEMVTIIPWPLRHSYRNSLKGKPDKHYAQPAMLHHSQFLCAQLELGSHILHVDIDEYVIGTKPLYSVAKANQTTEFLNQWAYNPKGIFGPHETQTLFYESTFADSLRRKKQLKPIKPFKPFYIHGKKGERNIQSEFVLLHFGLQKAINSNFSTHKSRPYKAGDCITKESMNHLNTTKHILNKYFEQKKYNAHPKTS